jgi:hypothetical protein
MSRSEVLARLTELRRKEGAEIPRTKAAFDLERMTRAGLTVLPCSVQQFIAGAGLIVLDPKDPEMLERVATVLENDFGVYRVEGGLSEAERVVEVLRRPSDA